MNNQAYGFFGLKLFAFSLIATTQLTALHVDPAWEEFVRKDQANQEAAIAQSKNNASLNPQQNKGLTRSAAQFAYLPEYLLNFVIAIYDNPTVNTYPFTTTELDTVAAMNDSDRITALQNRDPLILRCIEWLTLYEFNQYALSIFDVNGANQEAHYLINEGVLDNSQDTISPGPINDQIFRLLIGLSENTPLSGAQQTLQSDLYNNLNNGSISISEPIAERKSLRVIHPVL